MNIWLFFYYFLLNTYWDLNAGVQLPEFPRAALYPLGHGNPTQPKVNKIYLNTVPPSLCSCRAKSIE